MKELKIAWVKYCGWQEIIVHDQGPEFMGSESQNPAGAAGVLTMPIDSQSPWQNGKTERAGQSFKHQLWDLDEECRRNNNLTGRKGWTGPGVVVAVSPTRTSFWISMRGCLLKCSSEQERKATDAEWLGAELSKTLAKELLKSRQRSGQRGYVDVETEGQPTEEPPADTRPDVNQILGAVIPAPSVLAPIPEESDSMDTTIPEIAESGPGIRPRQPESEPGSEPADRNVRPRLAPDQEVTRLDLVETSQSTTQARGDVGQTPDEVLVDNPLGAASSILSPYPLISASNYLTVLPVETELDSKAQAVVHGSVDAVTEQDSTTFEAFEGMAVLESEAQYFWVAHKPKDKSGVVYDELSETNKKKSTHPDSRKSTTC